jgi:hypothetical protein
MTHPACLFLDRPFRPPTPNHTAGIVEDTGPGTPAASRSAAVSSGLRVNLIERRRREIPSEGEAVSIRASTEGLTALSLLRCRRFRI